METKFAWQRPHPLSSESTAAISWMVPDGAQPGTYRLRHFGDSKGMLGGISPFSGASGRTRECVFAILLQHSGSQQGHRSGRCCVFFMRRSLNQPTQGNTCGCRALPGGKAAGGSVPLDLCASAAVLSGEPQCRLAAAAARVGRRGVGGGGDCVAASWFSAWQHAPTDQHCGRVALNLCTKHDTWPC